MGFTIEFGAPTGALDENDLPILDSAGDISIGWSYALVAHLLESSAAFAELWRDLRGGDAGADPVVTAVTIQRVAAAARACFSSARVCAR